jgi:hypothetical protein
VCGSTTTSTVVALSPGSADLKSLGKGEWQFNWKTDKAFKGQCRSLDVLLADGTVHTATFRFQA